MLQKYALEKCLSNTGKLTGQKRFIVGYWRILVSLSVVGYWKLGEAVPVCYSMPKLPR